MLIFSRDKSLCQVSDKFGKLDCKSTSFIACRPWHKIEIAALFLRLIEYPNSVAFKILLPKTLHASGRGLFKDLVKRSFALQLCSLF